jgi:DNA-binding transcriptional LysR family regulator
LLRCSFCIACAEYRWPAKRGKPRLTDFREDNFLAISAGDHMHLIRTVCQREARFEPNLLALGDSVESLLSMVAAGRGVLLAPEILFQHRVSGVRLHVLDALKEQFEMFFLRRKSDEPAATVDSFLKILAESVLRLLTSG